MQEEKVVKKIENRAEVLDKVKRPYTKDDVDLMKAKFKAYEQHRVEKNGQFVMHDADFYEFLVSAERTENTAFEEQANPQSYETLILTFYKEWKNNLVKNKPEVLEKRPKIAAFIDILAKLPDPNSLEELRELYRNYQSLNEMSAVSYQDGLGEKGSISTPFLHFKSSRKSGYEHEDTPKDFRIYLNPPQQVLPELAKEFTTYADQEGVPYYFKLIDFSLQRPSNDVLSRTDRLIFYTDKEHVEKILTILAKIKKSHPEWFQERKLPNMTAKVSNGVGIAEDPSEFQRIHFSKLGENKVSFNWVRAKFLREVWQEATRQIVLQNPNLRPREGRTLKELLLAEVPMENSFRDQLSNGNFDPSTLNDEGKKVLEAALLRLMVKIIPLMSSEDVYKYVAVQVKDKAKKYGIDPENIALNAK